MIYLIVCDTTNVCKIGYSTNPKNRLKILQTGNPYKLKIFSTILGNRYKENIIHEMFNKYSLIGEWFTYNEDIKNLFMDDNIYLNYIKSKKLFKKPKGNVSLRLFNYLKKSYRDFWFSIGKSLKIIIAEKIKCSLNDLDLALRALILKGYIVQRDKNLLKVSKDR